MIQEQTARSCLYLINCEQNAPHYSLLAPYNYLQTSGLHNVGGPEFSGGLRRALTVSRD